MLCTSPRQGVKRRARACSSGALLYDQGHFCDSLPPPPPLSPFPPFYFSLLPSSSAFSFSNRKLKRKWQHEYMGWECRIGRLGKMLCLVWKMTQKGRGEEIVILESTIEDQRIETDGFIQRRRGNGYSVNVIVRRDVTGSLIVQPHRFGRKQPKRSNGGRKISIESGGKGREGAASLSLSNHELCSMHSLHVNPTKEWVTEMNGEGKGGSRWMEERGGMNDSAVED